MTMEEIQQAVAQEEEREDNLRKGCTPPPRANNTRNNAHQFLRAVQTSCRAMGDTAEAAEYARKKCFALQDFFGMHSLFVSISPDSECSFRVSLFANCGNEVSSFHVFKNSSCIYFDSG